MSVALLPANTTIAIAASVYKPEEFQTYFDLYYPELVASAKGDYTKWGARAGFENEMVFTIEPGSRYVKIVHSMTNGSQRSVFGFIDKKTGNVLKAASWKQPALNFPRGHVMITPNNIRWTGIM